MKKLLFFLCLSVSEICHASVRDTLKPLSGSVIIDSDTFVIKQRLIPAGCHGTDSVVTNEVWYGKQKLIVSTDPCHPECAVTIISLSFIAMRDSRCVLKIESSGVLGNYKSYFIKEDLCTYARMR